MLPHYDTADKLSESHEFRYHAPPTHTTHLHRDSNRSNTHNFRLLRRSCLGEEIENARGKPLTLNVTGALGAVLNEIDFPVEVMRAVAAVGRAAGLIGHVYEEMQNPIVPAVVDFINNIEYRDPD